jgi:adenine-specific DNA-methyltransferase
VPTLEFKGKPFVYAHHLSVPFRELVVDAGKSLPGDGGPNLDDNLIIHGDNLEALKALLPKYAGRVDCIFIDPPYNTGNEGWSYNDNVNSPLMKDWLGKTVDSEDMERHDKWAGMMWPRLELLHELLSEDGSLWMTLDDNEVAGARLILDEIFGSQNFIATCIWHKVYSPKNTAKHLSEDHDYVLVYGKNAASWSPALLPRTAEMEARYINPDSDPRGVWKPSDLTARNYYSRGRYEVVGPSGKTFTSASRYWRQSYESFLELDKENKIWWGEDGSNMPAQKRFLTDVKQGITPQTIWHYSEVGHTQEAKQELLRIMGFNGETEIFVTPKPVRLIERVLALGSSEDSIILDSFSGSGTTAHAVLAANAKDGGNRKFILIETEDYADTLTAERVRRVAKGYSFKGNQKTELMRENVTWSKLQRADALLAKVASYDNLDAHRFDRIEKTIKDGKLIVTGITECKETAPGLGGSFTYCELGEPMDMARFFDGANPPAFEQVARYVAYTATGATLDTVAEGPDHLIGEAGGYRLHLIYKPDTAFMRSDDAMLDIATAEAIAAAGRVSGKPILIFAAGKYMGQKQLTAMGLTFCQLPYAIHKMLPGDGDGE